MTSQSAKNVHDVVHAISGLEPRFVDVDGIRTRVYDVGQGVPVVLWHGSGWTGGASANTWNLNIPGLAKKFRVIAPDKLASGMTDNPARIEDFTIEAQVAHGAGVLRALGIDKCHMVGQSRGAYLAARLVLENPDLAHTLTIVDSATLAPDQGDVEERRQAIFSTAPRDPLGWAKAVYQGFSYTFDHITDEFLEAYASMDRSEKSLQTKRMFKEGGSDRFAETLAEQKKQTLEMIAQGALNLPVLLTWSVNDRTAFFSQGLDLFHRICEKNAQTRMYVFNQSGHFPYREYPEEWNAVFENFVRTFAG